MSFFHSLLSEGVAFYVRPAGTTYGTGDGLSYDNAWSGNAGIDWEAIPPKAILYGAGNWFESLSVENSDITLRSLIADPWIFTGDFLINTAISIIGKSNIILTDIVTSFTLVNGFYFENCTNVITNNCEGSNTGNQGFQHIGTTTFTHNNPIARNNGDDGISVHDAGIGIINGGIFDGNLQNINIIATAQVIINDNPTFVGVSDYDLYVTNATTPNSSTITMNGGTVRNVNADIGGRLILNDVVVTGTTNVSQDTGAGSLVGIRSIFIGQFNNWTGGTITLTRCHVSLWGTVVGVVSLSHCNILSNLATAATLTAEYCFFDGTGTTNELLDITSGGSAQLKYCIFTKPAALQFCLAFRTGALASSVNNCAFIGSGNVGRGLFTQIDLTTNNNIAFDFEIGYFRSAGTSILNNWCFNDCNTAKSGTVTSNNEVTGNPLFTNVATNDYSLLPGSSCIGTGADLGDTYDGGIESANWGDDEVVPELTTGLQAANWNIGAYI